MQEKKKKRSIISVIKDNQKGKNTNTTIPNRQSCQDQVNHFLVASQLKCAHKQEAADTLYVINDARIPPRAQTQTHASQSRWLSSRAAREIIILSYRWQHRTHSVLMRGWSTAPSQSPTEGTVRLLMGGQTCSWKSRTCSPKVVCLKMPPDVFKDIKILWIIMCVWCVFVTKHDLSKVSILLLLSSSLKRPESINMQMFCTLKVQQLDKRRLLLQCKVHSILCAGGFEFPHHIWFFLHPKITCLISKLG